MTVALSQTVEDGPPRDRVDRILRHEGHITENIVVGLEVRHPDTHSVMRTRLVIRAYQSDGEITAAWGQWNDEDGA
jgi:hypothetical protein